MKTYCPQCRHAETAQLDISSALVQYLKCQTCECVFYVDRFRPWAEPFVVTTGHAPPAEGDGGGNAAES